MPRPRRGIPCPGHKMPSPRPVPTLSAPAPGRAVGRTRLARLSRLSPSRHCPTGGMPRPRRVGFGSRLSFPFVTFPNAAASCNRNPPTARLGLRRGFPLPFRQRERVLRVRVKGLAEKNASLCKENAPARQGSPPAARERCPFPAPWPGVPLTAENVCRTLPKGRNAQPAKS